jgi:hypothetical protein
MGISNARSSDTADLGKRCDSASIFNEHLGMQIGRSVYSGLKSELESFYFQSSFSAPAVVRDVSFSTNRARLVVDVPFSIPDPTGDADDWLPSAKSVEEFKREFRSYLREQRIGRQISNLFFHEYGDFLLRFLRAHRLGRLPSGVIDKTGKPLTIADSLIRPRRCAGRRSDSIF